MSLARACHFFMGRAHRASADLGPRQKPRYLAFQLIAHKTPTHCREYANGTHDGVGYGAHANPGEPLSVGCPRGPVSRGATPSATNQREHPPKKCSVQCSSETDSQAPLTSENPCGKWQGTNTSGLTRIASPVPSSDTRYLPPSASKPRMRQREFASSGRD